MEPSNPLYPLPLPPRPLPLLALCLHCGACDEGEGGVQSPRLGEKQKPRGARGGGGEEGAWWPEAPTQPWIGTRAAFPFPTHSFSSPPEPQTDTHTHSLSLSALFCTTIFPAGMSSALGWLGWLEAGAEGSRRTAPCLLVCPTQRICGGICHNFAASFLSAPPQRGRGRARKRRQRRQGGGRGEAAKGGGAQGKSGTARTRRRQESTRSSDKPFHPKLRDHRLACAAAAPCPPN